MKKYAIAIIGLVFASLVLGSCDIKTGGTIVVKNGFSTPMLIAVGKWLPNIEEATTVDVGAEKSFSFDDDGLYSIGYATVGTKGTAVNVKTEYLSGGETKRVTIGP